MFLESATEFEKRSYLSESPTRRWSIKKLWSIALTWPFKKLTIPLTIQNCRLTVSSSEQLFFVTFFSYWLVCERNFNLYFWLDFQTYNAILYGVVIIWNTTSFLLLYNLSVHLLRTGGRGAGFLSAVNLANVVFSSLRRVITWPILAPFWAGLVWWTAR